MHAWRKEYTRCNIPEKVPQPTLGHCLRITALSISTSQFRKSMRAHKESICIHTNKLLYITMKSTMLCYEYYLSTRLTFNCRFSSASLFISDCSLLHFSSTFFISVSSSEAETGTEAADESAFAEFITGAALVASTSFCPTSRGREPLK